MFKTINPLDNKLVKAFEELSTESLQEKLKLAENTYQKFWRHTRFSTRAATLRSIAKRLKNEEERLGALITLEMGKPAQQAIAEVQKCALLCEYYAAHGERFLQPKQTVSGAGAAALVSYEPMGAILGIMPWNFPLWQAMRFAVPAIMAGNVVLLKHAPNVPQCALALEDVFKNAIRYDGVFQNLFIATDKVSKVLEHSVVQGVALTGSERAGSAVAGLAGKNIKKSVLELGGSDAFIVLEDADLEQAAEVAVRSRMHNSGQTCISAKRFIVTEPVAQKFTNLLLERYKHLKVGLPDDRDTTISCLARPDLVDKLEQQVADAVAKGAKLLVKGGRKKGAGNFYLPELLTNIKPGMRAYKEELFGPTGLLFVVKNEAAAIQLANDTAYGLGGAIWTQNLERGMALAKELEVGAVAINNLVRSDPSLPFGGVKRSGFGRELAMEGIREFVSVKTVVVG